jgi:hypothetical protein
MKTLTTQTTPLAKVMAKMPVAVVEDLEEPVEPVEALEAQKAREAPAERLHSQQKQATECTKFNFGKDRSLAPSSYCIPIRSFTL